MSDTGGYKTKNLVLSGFHPCSSCIPVSQFEAPDWGTVIKRDFKKFSEAKGPTTCNHRSIVDNFREINNGKEMLQDKVNNVLIFLKGSKDNLYALWTGGLCFFFFFLLLLERLIKQLMAFRNKS